MSSRPAFWLSCEAAKDFSHSFSSERRTWDFSVMFVFVAESGIDIFAGSVGRGLRAGNMGCFLRFFALWGSLITSRVAGLRLRHHRLKRRITGRGVITKYDMN